MLNIYVNADTLIRWDGLQNKANSQYINDATVTFTLKDEDGTVVTGAENRSMPYVATSNGRYQGTLESTVSLTAATAYYLEITATRGGLVGFRRIRCTAVYRGEI